MILTSKESLLIQYRFKHIPKKFKKIKNGMSHYYDSSRTNTVRQQTISTTIDLSMKQILIAVTIVSLAVACKNSGDYRNYTNDPFL